MINQEAATKFHGERVILLVTGFGCKPAGPEEKIAYASVRGGNIAIWVMNADGSGLQPSLTLGV
jgi:hypothetical protein